MTEEPEGPMTVHVNGEARNLPAGTTIADLVVDLVGGTEVRGVAAALNGSVVPRGRWASCLLADSDRVEVLTAVQGG
ncbi:MAG: sulfur carrier protein ThiS [Sporichthyaceae bacterium]